MDGVRRKPARERKSVQIVIGVTPDMAKRIERFRSRVSKQHGVDLSLSATARMLMLDGLTNLERMQR